VGELPDQLGGAIGGVDDDDNQLHSPAIAQQQQLLHDRRDGGPSLKVGSMIDSRGADTGPAPMEVQGDGANPGDSKLRKVT